MKLKLIFPVALLILASTASAQISVGAHAGAAFSKPSLDDPASIPGLSYDIKSRTGIYAGLMADMPLGESGFRFMPELNFVNKGFIADASIDLLGQQFSVESKSNISYIELPVNFAYSIPLSSNRLMVGAGPYAGYGIGGKTVAKTTAGGVSEEEEADIEFGSAEGQFDRFDFGANFMAAYVMNNGLMFKVNYSLGLINLSNDSESDYKNRYFGVSVGYFFLQGGK